MWLDEADAEFLSTPSARRATLCFHRGPLLARISIHALREEGALFQIALVLFAGPISIHALREEGDEPADDRGRRGQNFYPRPPRGGRRQGYVRLEISKKISIHALREEGDDPRHRRRHHDQNFYPRPPRGGRPTNQTAGATSPGFLSTPSARRATKAASMPRNNFRFLSTPSARRATLRRERLTDFLMISIHALREEGDLLFR